MKGCSAILKTSVQTHGDISGGEEKALGSKYTLKAEAMGSGVRQEEGTVAAA